MNACPYCYQDETHSPGPRNGLGLCPRCAQLLSLKDLTKSVFGRRDERDDRRRRKSRRKKHDA